MFKGSSRCSQLTVFTSSDSGKSAHGGPGRLSLPEAGQHWTCSSQACFLAHHLDHFAMFLCGRYPMIPQLWITNRLMSDCWPPGWSARDTFPELWSGKSLYKWRDDWFPMTEKRSSNVELYNISKYMNKYTAMMSMQILHNLAIYDPSQHISYHFLFHMWSIKHP